MSDDTLSDDERQAFDEIARSLQQRSMSRRWVAVFALVAGVVVVMIGVVVASVTLALCGYVAALAAAHRLLCDGFARNWWSSIVKRVLPRSA